MSNILAERPVIQGKATQIADMITRSLEMEMFKRAERELHSDEEANALLQEVQRQQTDEQAVEALLDRLENLDVVRHFTFAQHELSEVVSHVTKIVAATVSDRFDLLIESEGGCGSCPVQGCGGPSECTGTSDAGACDATPTAS